MSTYRKSGLQLLLGAVLLLMAVGCQKQSASTAPTPVPTDRTSGAGAIRVDADPPTVDLNASPATVELGDASTLTWKSSGASTILIDGEVGNVGETGSVTVTPRESTTYTALATGPGGEARSSTRVTVVERSMSPSVLSTDIESLQEAISEGSVRPIFFDYDQAELTSDSKAILEENARWFRRFPAAQVIIEGHCDERGTEEYNLALGDRRAEAVRQFLLQVGLESTRLDTISYGEERPFAQGYDERAYRQNRRAHFVVEGSGRLGR